MGKCCGDGRNVEIKRCDPCEPPEVEARCGNRNEGACGGPLGRFASMIQNCYEYATKAKGEGRRIVGIMCEYTPRELIMAAGAVPVCLCGGSAEMIGPAEEHLPTNLCPLIKSTYGYHVQKANPFLEMADLIVAETTCDGKKKMYELMGQSRPVYVLELPQKPDDEDAMRHWVAELRKFKAHLERTFGVEITEDRLKSAVAIMNRERGLRRRLAEVMSAALPALTGRQLLDFKSIISGIPEDLAEYEKAAQRLEKLSRCANGEGVRVLMTGVPQVHGAERVIELIEDNGGLVVCMDNCTGLKPILEDVDADADDLIEALAEKYIHLPCSVMTKNERRLEMLREMANQYRPECVIELIWQCCLTYDVESYLVRRFVEEELGIPYLRIETDYSPSDSARIALRVEALFETVRDKRPKKECSA
jgi:benzoyl-CoA reductase/2-hydroxyglutaryl-CoA dehydratase subunit BcrC/BadD/HgdB